MNSLLTSPKSSDDFRQCLVKQNPIQHKKANSIIGDWKNNLSEIDSLNHMHHTRNNKSMIYSNKYSSAILSPKGVSKYEQEFLELMKQKKKQKTKVNFKMTLGNNLKELYNDLNLTNSFNNSKNHS